MVDDAGTNLLAAYNLTGGAPYEDHMKFLPDLSWTPIGSLRTETNAPFPDGRTWLVSRTSVPSLVKHIQATGQFSVRVVCTPSRGRTTEGHIVSISQPQGTVNLTLQQNDTNLVFVFRNELSANEPLLAWSVPDVFVAGQTRDILFSYNGSDLFLYIDGQKKPHSYKLGPGAALVHSLRRGRTNELEGYHYAYYLLVFLPAGFIFGVSARKLNWHDFKLAFPIVASALLPCVLLELTLASVSSRLPSSRNVVLSVCFILAACLWVNADRPISPGNR